MNIKKQIYFWIFCFAFLSCSVLFNKSEHEIYMHSHNDYEHEHPLFDALNQNFRSIEADVYSIGDSLFIAHDFDKIKSGRTLRSLYLEPLKIQIRKNGGSVYGDGKEIILLVDIKRDGLKTYKLLHQILQDYKSDLSVFENGVKTTGSILVVVSGNRPFEFMKAQSTRFAGYDGRLNNLNVEISAQLMPVVSDDWTEYFSWDGTGEMPEADKQLLNNYVTEVHEKGCLLRFWDTPNKTPKQNKKVWTALFNAGVDVIGTDHLEELSAFISEQKSHQ